MSFWFAVNPPQPKWVILLEWIVICLSITTGCILVATTIYASRYQQFRFIEARRWNLLLTSSCFAIIEAFIREPFYILLRMGFFGQSALPDYANTILYATFVHGYTILTVVRLWLAMYDIRHTEAVKKKAWRLKINPDHQDFYLFHRRTLGNYSWLWKRLAAGEFVVAASMLCVMRRFVGAWHLINTLWVISLGSFLAVTYWKLRQIKFKDIFFFHEELRLEVLILLTSFIGYILSFVFLANPRTRSHTPFGSFFLLYYEVGTTFVATFVQTRWNVNRLEQHRIAKQPKNGGLQTDEEDPPRPSFRVDVQTYYLVTVEQCRTEFARVIATQDGFDAFIDHLVSEFSLESLLFIVEVMQYKTSLVKRSSVSTKTVFSVDLSFMPLSLTRDITGESEDGGELETGFWLTLPPELPHSPLAEILDEFDRGSYLYEKYVSTEAEMEINISYGCRLELQKYFEKVEDDVMWSSVSSGSSRSSTKSKELLFDDAAQEVMTLMLDAFQRFKLGLDG